MFSLDMSDALRVAANLEVAEKQTRFVMAYAMTTAMKEAREAEVQTMKSVFDRPTRYTLNSLQVVPAKRDNLSTELRPKEFGGTPAWKYLGPQVRGGGRRAKAFERRLRSAGILRADEYAVPAKGVALDTNGNLKGGALTRILSAVGANPDALSNTTKRPKRSNRRRNLDYFVGRGRLPRGIYLRTGHSIAPVLIFVRQPTYRPRFPFYQEAARVFRPAFHRHFNEGWRRFVINDPKRKRAR